MMCECYQVGGRFVAEDPDCPTHGVARDERRDRVDELIRQTEETTDVEVLRYIARQIAEVAIDG